MSDATMWFVLAGVLVALELMTGSFYLLMLGLGALAAALAALAGHGLSVQLMVAAAVGGLGQWRKRQAITPQDTQDQNLDLGATVMVEAWDAQGTTQVKHRGAVWGAVHVTHQAPAPGAHRIQAMVGNRLLLERI